MSQNLYEIYNTTFNDIQKDYLYIFSNGSRLENYFVENLKNGSNNEIDDDLLNFETALNTLSIYLRNIKFKIQQFEDSKINSPNSATNIPSNFQSNSQPDIQTDKLINKTINDLFPYFLIALLANDKDSILNKPNIFTKSNKQVKREAHLMAEKEKIQKHIREEEIIKQNIPSFNKNSSKSSVYDLD